MKIIIDIPNEDIPNKQEARYISLHFIAGEVCECTYPYIVLSKGHGKLIVEPTDDDIAKTIGGQSDFAECIRDSVKAVFDNATAIIEADRAESELHRQHYQ